MQSRPDNRQKINDHNKRIKGLYKSGGLMPIIAILSLTFVIFILTFCYTAFGFSSSYYTIGENFLESLKIGFAYGVGLYFVHLIFAVLSAAFNSNLKANFRSEELVHS